MPFFPTPTRPLSFFKMQSWKRQPMSSSPLDSSRSNLKDPGGLKPPERSPWCWLQQIESRCKEAGLLPLDLLFKCKSLMHLFEQLKYALERSCLFASEETMAHESLSATAGTPARTYSWVACFFVYTQEEERALIIDTIKEDFKKISNLTQNSLGFWDRLLTAGSPICLRVADPTLLQFL